MQSASPQYRALVKVNLTFDSLDVGVQRPDIVAIPNIDLFRDLLASLDDFEKLHQAPPLIVCERERMSVRYPAMNSSSTRVDP